MLRCVILDDEPMILRSMRKKIETLHSGFEVVGTATDGKQGLRLILEQHPDCVFTDINMPVIDGLELIERVQAQCSEPPVFVIMSGYSEFAFARKALRLNVIDYLIKPVSNANLVALLAEIEARLLQDIHQKTAAAIDKLLDNLAEERDLHVVQKQLDSGRGCFYAAKICVGPFLTQRFHHIRLERRTDNIFDFDSVCSDCCNAGESYSIHYDNYFNERTLFFRIQQDPDTFLSKLLAAIRRHLGENLHVTCILTPPLKSAEQLGRLREVLDHALYDSAIFSRSNFVQMGPEWTCPARTSVEIDDALMRSVDLLSSVAAAQRLPVVQELLGICSEQCCPQIQLVRVIRKLLAATDRGDRSNLALLSDVLVCASDSYDDLLTGFEEIQRSGSLPEIQDLEDDGDTRTVINKVLEYINANYKEHILVQDIARRFGFNSSYLSTIFRKYKGISPNEYIIQRRILEAKMLLRLCPERTVRDIANDVGYDDAYYFSRVFRNVTGISPTEYRKQQTATGDAHL